MAGIRLIKRRITSANNIAQITRAMQLVAASKMRKAQNSANSGKAYADKIYQAVSDLARYFDTDYHKLLVKNNLSSKTLVILITTNKGLCGSLNTNLFRKISGEWQLNRQNTDFITLGSKGASFVVRNGYKLVADFSAKAPFTEYAQAVIEMVTGSFVKGEYKNVVLVYNSFINALNLQPVQKTLLPMSAPEIEVSKNVATNAYLLEPSPEDLLNALLPHYLEVQVRAAIIQAEASEHSARMFAMKSATDNANSIASELTLIYNKLRQEQITYEIADITRAQISLS